MKIPEPCLSKLNNNNNSLENIGAFRYCNNLRKIAPKRCGTNWEMFPNDLVQLVHGFRITPSRVIPSIRATVQPIMSKH